MDLKPNFVPNMQMVCIGTSAFSCVNSQRDLVQTCEDCKNRWHYLSDTYANYSHLSATRKDAFHRVASTTPWHVSMTNGIRLLMTNPLTEQDITTITRNVIRRQRWLDTEYDYKRPGVERQTSYLLTCRVSNTSKPHVPNNYMEKLESSIEVITRRQDLYPGVIPGEFRDNRLYIAGKFASPGKANSSIFSLNGLCQDGRGGHYRQLSALSNCVDQIYEEGDNIVIAMAHPLHFVAGKPSLLEFILELQLRDISLKRVFFFVLGADIFRTKLVIEPMTICANDMNEFILNENEFKKNLSTVHRNVTKFMSCMELEIEKRVLGSSPGRSSFEVLPG